jgi:hypothetical protein
LDGCIVDTVVKTYVNGILVGTHNYSINTVNSGPYEITGLTFGEQIVTMTKNVGSDPADVFEFTGIDAIVTDVKLEMKKGIQGAYSDWVSIPLTMAKAVDSDYPGFSNVYTYAGTTPDWNGADGYQFKLMIASSDNTATPEIITTDIHTQSTEDYSDTGFWKTTIDLGSGVESIDSLTFSVTNTDNTKVEIRTRTGAVDGAWDPWSVPYSADTARAVLDCKANPTFKDGFIITPVITPENLTSWQSFKLRHLLNNIDMFTGADTRGSTITVEVVTGDYNPHPATLAEQQANVNMILGTFTYTSDMQIERIISGLTNTSLRFKINLYKEVTTSTPAIEHLFTMSNAYYKEDRTFGTGDTDLKGYGSAVYGLGTGIDKVYTDGTGRSVQATIPAFAFTIPLGAENPDYEIEIDHLFSEVYTAEEVDVYWNSNSSKITNLPGDYLMVRVQEPKGTGRIKKHYRYGSGLATIISPNFLSSPVTNIFSPNLLTDRKYAYYVMNGFPYGTPNANLSIRWKSENDVITALQRHTTYTLNDSVYISIVTSQQNGLIDWISEEKKFSAIVNANDIHQSYVTTLLYNDNPALSQIPEIEPEIILNSDTSIIPYKVEVIEGSVVSHGIRKPEDLIITNVRYINSALSTTPSLKTHVEEKVKMIRAPGTNIDRLPKAMAKQITGNINGRVLGIYQDITHPMPDYDNKINENDGTELAEGDYKFYAAPGTYSNVIDWAPGIAAATAPADGATYYVTYAYDRVVSLRVELSCDYSEYEPSLQIYRSPTLTYTGECTPMTDYSSEQFSFDSFTIPADVDRSTLNLVVYDDNPMVRTYIDGNKVVGTLDGRDPRTSWNPSIRGGNYYINKDSYYMFINPNEYALDDSLIPIAKNISYTNGYNGTGILIEEGTVNLAPVPQKASIRETAFVDSFERQA